MTEYSTWFSDELNITGSETSWSHYAYDTKKTTYNIDFGSNGKFNRNRYAPFTCKVKYIDTKSNGIYCETVEPVHTPFTIKNNLPPMHMCFEMAHFNSLKWKVGDTIKQGELIGVDGTKANGELNQVAQHTHMMFGKGKMKSSRVYKVGNAREKVGKPIISIYSLACTDGLIHCYDFMFIKKDCKITTNPSYAGASYKWVTVPEQPIIVTVTGELIDKKGDVYTIKASSVK